MSEKLFASQKLVIYTGSTQSWKGVDTLEKTRNFLLGDIEVLIVSERPHGEVPLYMKAADVLVLPLRRSASWPSRNNYATSIPIP